MGRRSRRRGHEIAAAPSAPPRRPRPERPRAPWHPFPLVELCVLIGLVLLVFGLIRADRPGGRELLVGGMVLASLGGLDTALREHLAGLRSHALVLAVLPAVLAAGVLFFARAPWAAIPLTASVVFAVAFAVARRTFRARG